jgi:hypothetical protein
VGGAYFGSVADFNSKVRPELMRGLTPSNPTVESLSWYDFLVKTSGETTIKTPVTGYDLHEDFFAKSVTVPESDGLAANTMNALYDHLKTAGSVSYYMGINSAIINAQPQTKFGAYLNYVDPSYDAATAHKLYYGDAIYSRLAALKKQVDPKSVFWHPQAIGA